MATPIALDTRARAKTALSYLQGFGNELASEALPGALPIGQNSPQAAAYGLYAEQLNLTSFTAPRAENRRSWLYRIRPSTPHGAYKRIDDRLLRAAPITETEPSPNRFRWDPQPLPDAATDFVDGLTTMAANGDPEARTGAAIHVYAANRSMTDRAFSNSDGEMLIVPQVGTLRLVTEFGVIELAPCEIAVVPRAVKLRVELVDGASRGFICENYGAHYRLPELGPIGSNGLANARDFQTPVAAFEDRDTRCEIVTKYAGGLWACEQKHSPFDVVAWHGSGAPYKYDMNRFNAINSVSYDHPDPSINTVLTSPAGLPGIANIDFCVFAPRWDVAEHTFRPPFYHRNVMSEFGALLKGASEARNTARFAPGAMTLHNAMAAHGPDPAVFEKSSTIELGPRRLEGMAVLFETRLPFRPTKFALTSSTLQRDYDQNWDALPKRFKP
jgi:homogentisate 1,2-dioxygenase